MRAAAPEQIDAYTRQGWWGTETLIDLFLRQAESTPDAVALVDPPNRADFTVGDPQRFTYAELQTRVDRLAAGLVRLGVGPDQVIMVQLPNIAELVICYLAAARIGAIISPVPVQYRTHELRQVLALAEPSVYLTAWTFSGFDYLAMLDGLLPDFPSVRAVIAAGPDVPAGVMSLDTLLAEAHDAEALAAYLRQHLLDANDVLTLCWTSGTEADPKGVPRSHNHWLSIAYVTVDGAELRPGDRLLNPFPLVNMSAIGGMLVPWLLTGGTLVMHQPLNLGVFLQQIRQEGIHYTVAPPVLLNLLLLKPALLADADLSTIRCIGSGSAPLSPWMVSQWSERYGIPVLNFFGSNEGTGLVSTPGDIPDPSERARYFPRYGVPGYRWKLRNAGGLSTKLVDPESKAVITEPGLAGELAIRGPAVFSGYYKRPDLTARAFDADGYFYTGDLFAIAGEGGELNRYRFVGRLKDIILRAGMKIAPEELENLLADFPKIAECAVVGIPDHRLNEEQVFVAVVAKPGEEPTLSEVVDFLKGKDIAAYKLPKKLVRVEALPRNPVGKVLKRALREKIEAALVARRTSAEPETDELALPV